VTPESGERTSIRTLVSAVNARFGWRGAEGALIDVRAGVVGVERTLAAIRAARARQARDAVATGHVRIDGPQGRIVDRAEPLTPYILETICDDARRAGPGASVTITLEGPVSDVQVAELRARLASVERLGAVVRVVRRDGARTS
jgi:hypothetical protein